MNNRIVNKIFISIMITVILTILLIIASNVVLWNYDNNIFINIVFMIATTYTIIKLSMKFCFIKFIEPNVRIVKK
ncbi:hypothetical protein FPHOBKDP_00079 [Listeria phage LPJP1]|nr:hypothetical protein FPHOBKDP_00079 [Listeria phage LPJP1]